MRRSLFRQKTSTEVLLDQGPQYLTRITKNYLHYRDTTPFIKLDYIFTLEKKFVQRCSEAKANENRLNRHQNGVRFTTNEGDWAAFHEN